MAVSPTTQPYRGLVSISHQRLGAGNTTAFPFGSSRSSGFNRAFLHLIIQQAGLGTSLPQNLYSSCRPLPLLRLPGIMRTHLALTGLLACFVSYASATALTYKLVANEKACFFSNVEQQGSKIAFYFAVRRAILARHQWQYLGVWGANVTLVE